ncbi:MAG: PDZ domain-containing protein [Lentisphaerae bacterium]|jgi:S1-C subfamily serine protease|nr:PDZ domain-containing protein [Lentisphaerota bacterium]
MKNIRKIALPGVLAAIMLSVAPLPVKAAETSSSSALKTAQNLEDAFVEVADKAKPAVVVITNRQTVAQRQTIFSDGRGSMGPQDFFEFFWGPNPYRSPQRERRQREQRRQAPRPRSEAVGRGSGVLISADGYLVTNFHVIKDHEYLEVKTADGKVYDNEKDSDAVTVVGIDEETDLAVLKLNGPKNSFPFLQFMDSDKLRVGQWAIAIGAPFELDYSVTVGCVSQTGRYNRAVSSFNNYIQTDASINPGNSGGPLLNIKGEIIGINQYIYTGGMSRGNIGLGFAIASNVVKYVTDSLIADGEVARAFLGVAMQELDEQLMKQFDVDFGVLVSDVIPGEAAEKAGVKPGDVIQKVGGREVTTSQELLQAVAKHRPGEDIVLSVVRNQKKLMFTIKAGRRQSSTQIARKGAPASEQTKDELGQLGLVLQEEDGKVVIKEVLPDGAVAQVRDEDGRQVMAGDIIHDVNQNAVTTVAGVREALKETRNKTVVLWLERKSRSGASMRFFIAIPLPDEKE